jgi:predicted extracellular nuclease
MLKLISIIGLLPLAACGLGPKTVGDDTGDTSVVVGGATIQQIQSGEIADGEVATLSGVIATSGFSTAGDGFFVQEPGGGEYSGIYVYLAAGAGELYLETGFELNLTGTVTEFYDWTEFSVTSSTAIEVVGTGTVTVDSVDPATVTTWEAWESCLISVGASSVSEGTNSYGEITLSNNMIVDDMFMSIDASSGDTFDDVIGLLGYSYSEWKLFPRDESDLVGYVAGVVESVTINDIQMGNISGNVEIEQVVVTSPMNASGDGFFVQEIGGGAYSGMYVYLLSGAQSVTFEVGDVVSISGSISEYYDLTELTVSDAADISWSSTVEAVTIDALDLTTVSDWEAWESCMVSITDVTATEAQDYGDATTDVSAGTNSDGDAMWLKVDNMFFDFESEAGTNWASVTGPVTYSYSDWRIAPRDNADLGL